jgi:hypothetical protein
MGAALCLPTYPTIPHMVVKDEKEGEGRRRRDLKLET